MPSNVEPSIRQLKALEAVARTGSFTAAAEELGVSQPTVSNLIVALERQTECRFLRRGNKGIETTEMFETLRPQIKALLALKSEVDLAIGARKDLKSGSFWVGYSTYQIAMPPIARFIQTHPGVTLNARAMASLDLLPLLRTGDLDVAFVTAREPLEAMHCQKIASFRIGIVAQSDGALRDVEILSWADVAKLRLIQREPNAGTRQVFERAASEAGIAPDTILGLGSWGSITSLVRAGVGEGVGLESELVAADKDLKFIPINDEKLGAHQFLVSMPAMAASATVRQFYEITQETLTGAND